MVDRNLLVRRGGSYTSRDGMILQIPPSGFDFRSISGHSGFRPDPFTDNESAQRYPLGTKLIYGEKWFRYCLAGGSALVVGNVIGAKAVVAGHTDETVVLTAGETTATFTPSATAITVNEYRDGYLSILSGTGLGYSFLVRDHALNDGSSALTLNLIDPVAVTGASTPKATLIQSPWGEVIQVAIITRIGQPVGIACGIITAAQFGWVQTHGPAAVLLRGTSVVGDDMVVPSAAAGAAGPRTTALAVKETVIGRAMEVSVTNGDTIQVFVTIE